jgi:hypothetical protein
MVEIGAESKYSKLRVSNDFPNASSSGATPPSKVISVSFGKNGRHFNIFNPCRLIHTLKHKRSLSFNPLIT